nr:hypothetical protein [uncultured Mucilaginibacter sp.]
MIKHITSLSLIMVSLCMFGCRIDHSKPLLITVAASAYVGSDKIYANFALLKSTDAAIVNNENTLAEYFKTHPGYTNYMSEFEEAGNYIIAIQLPASSTREKLYTYRDITISKDHPSTDNNMVFDLANSGYYQVWKNK